MAATARAVDLSNVKEGGGSFRPRRKPEGDYRAKFVKADDHEPKDKTKPKGWVMTVQIDGDARSTYPVYLSPEEKQVWKIAQACRAAGLKVPSSRVRFDPNKLVNKAIGVFLEDDEYEGRQKSVIAEMFPVSEVGANADEDAPDGDEILDDDEVDTDIEAYGDDNEDTAEVEDDEEPEPEPEPKPRRRRKPAPEPEPEPEDDEEEYEDEEEPPPPPRKRAPAKKAAAAPKRRRAAPPVEDDDLDLEDLDD